MYDILPLWTRLRITCFSCCWECYITDLMRQNGFISIKAQALQLKSQTIPAPVGLSFMGWNSSNLPVFSSWKCRQNTISVCICKTLYIRLQYTGCWLNDRGCPDLLDERTNWLNVDLRIWGLQQLTTVRDSHRRCNVQNKNIVLINSLNCVWLLIKNLVHSNCFVNTI